jgi:hypothetical protein
MSDKPKTYKFYRNDVIGFDMPELIEAAPVLARIKELEQDNTQLADMVAEAQRLAVNKGLEVAKLEAEVKRLKLYEQNYLNQASVEEEDDYE